MTGAGIVVSVNLPGAMSGSVAHTTKQIGRVDVSPIGSKNPEWITRKIKHTDRTPVPCVRVVNIEEKIVAEWQKSDCPIWANAKFWRTMSKKQKLEAHLSRFDEGFGITYE